MQHPFRTGRLALLLLTVGLLARVAAAQDAGFHVAPGGDDGASGTAGHPFRTLQRALDASRAVSRARDGDVEIIVHDGTHRLTAPLVLDARDSGPAGHALVIRAAPGARPVVSGAVPVTGWTRVAPGADVWQAAVAPGLASRQLFVNGVRAVRARTADYPAEFARTPEGYVSVFFEPAPSSWGNVRDVEAVTVGQWKGMRCPVGSVDGAFVTMQNPCWRNANVFQAPGGADPLWSFTLLARFENALAFLDAPGEWYLDAPAGLVYYMPRPGEDLATADVELPLAEALVDGQGTREAPLERIRIEGLTFAYATWLRPSSPDGYVADQSGFTLTGWDHGPNVIGHAEHVVRTPGAVRFAYARRITVVGNRFEHLGAVALDFATGSQRNRIVGNRFTDVSSAAIQLGGVDDVDHHPPHPADWTRDNRITDNHVLNVGQEFIDAPGIYVGFATRTLVAHNDVDGTPWSGIALGWGWGLYDPHSFPGLPNATSGEWGTWLQPTTSRGNRVARNRITNFLQQVWDGGAVYTQGQQGRSYRDGERIVGNVAFGKRPRAGGNTFYTDGGSRYVTLEENVSYDNPQGVTDFGPCETLSALPLCWLQMPYGSDRGGCIPYGDIRYRGNYWQSMEFFFYDVCWRPPYPVDLQEAGERYITGPSDVPARILRAAGRRPRWRD